MENRFVLLTNEPLVTLVNEPQFFTSRGEDCEPLVINCTLALAALPAITPPLCKIQRSQYEDIKTRLQNLISDFIGLQINVNIVLNSATDAATKASTLAIIVSKLPDIASDFIFMKLECEKIKKAMTI